MAQLDAGGGVLGSSWDAFVGRAGELVVVGDALDGTLAGRGRLVLVSGEAGIGKTRFAEQVAARATDRGAAVLWASCWDGPGAPLFWPWTQVVRAYERLHDRATLLEDLGEGAADVAVLSQQGVLVDAPAEPDGEPEQLRFRLFDSFSRFLVVAARRQPLLVVLDDLHAADSSSLRLLRFLLPQLRAARLLLLGTYRQPDADPGSPLVGELAGLASRATSISLGGLSRGEVAQLVAAVWPEPADDRLVAWTHEHTGGNPLFVKELTSWCCPTRAGFRTRARRGPGVCRRASGACCWGG